MRNPNTIAQPDDCERTHAPSMSDHRLARDQFDATAAHYAVSRPHAHSDSLAIVRKWVAGKRYTTALDIATGPGFTAFAIAPYCNKVMASDISSAMLKQVGRSAGERQHNNIKPAIADATALPFPDAEFQLVTCRTAPHHFNDIPKFISEARRTLTPNGTFILVDTSTVTEPDARAWHHKVELARDPSHAKALTPDEWVTAMQQAGFAIVDTAMTRVNMTFRDWVARSNTPCEVVRELERDFATAPDSVRSQFNVRPNEDGSDFSFSWPVFCGLAKKQ